MTLFASPMLAIAFGAFLLCAETCLHFESLLALPGSWLSLPIHDWIAGGFLVYGGVRSRREWNTGRIDQLARGLSMRASCAGPEVRDGRPPEAGTSCGP